MTTYVERHENVNVSDKDTLETLAELNARTDGGWIIRGVDLPRGWFSPQLTGYELLHRLEAGGVEYQIIGFHPASAVYPSMPWGLTKLGSINAYMTGYLAGLDRTEKANGLDS